MDISSNGEPIKVEVVNFDSFEDQLRKKLLLAMVGAAGTLLIEKGLEALTKKIMEKRTQKAKEVKKP